MERERRRWVLIHRGNNQLERRGAWRKTPLRRRKVEVECRTQKGAGIKCKQGRKRRREG